MRSDPAPRAGYSLSGTIPATPQRGPTMGLPMDKFVVEGGNRLEGTVAIGGAKNSALKLMAASLLAEGHTVIQNVPRIVDCATMAEVLEHLGASVSRDDHIVHIDTSGVHSQETPYELVNRMRASIIVLGPLLARYGRARVAMPGGCNIGSRSIDLHMRGLERMGARFEFEHGYLEAVGDLRGAVVTIHFPSVGATQKLLVADLEGARIQGAGSPTVEIEGMDRFRPAQHAVIPDRIEAGTFAIAVCATQGDVVLQGARGDHLDLPLSKLAESGAEIRLEPDGFGVRMDGRPLSVDFVTLPYPGFATDLQPQMMAMLATARETSILTENVFESRFMFVDELIRMGAEIRVEGHHAVIRGIERLSAAPVRALDIRAGAAMVIAALSAEGTTEISDVHYIDRGYEDFEVKLGALGARIRRERERAPA